MVKEVHRRRVSLGVASALVAGVAGLAILHPGMPSADVSLNDGGVWVTNGNQRLVAHLNYPSLVLDGGLRAASENFDVTQRADRVYVKNTDAKTTSNVNVAAVALAGESVPFGSLAFDVHGDELALLDAPGGKLWLLDAASANIFDPIETEPAATDVDDSVMAFRGDGAVVLASAERGETAVVTRDGDEAFAIERTGRPELSGRRSLAVAAVGEQVVALDTDSGALILPSGRTVDLPGEGWRLQQSGADASTVLVATRDSLLTVALSNGEVTPLAQPASGDPVAPVLHRGCAYAAWGTSARFVRDCPNDADDVEMDVKGLETATEATFRTNRDVIVLNDMRSGGVWLPDEKMILVDNWDQINNELTKEEKTEDDKSAETLDEEQVVEPNEGENNPPVAVDDSFGVRPGRSILLPVILNDSDEDGDVLVARPLTQPGFGEVAAVRQGAALQVRVPEDATGSTSFTYEINDGRGGKDSARVSLTVRPWSTNEAPKQTRATRVTIGSKGTVSLNVLNEWVDPDGDPFYLKTATSPEGLSIVSRPDGRVQITDLGQASGRVEVALVVSDGTADAEGLLVVQVREGGNLPPVANGDHVVALRGTPVTVNPLANDTDPNGDVLRLAAVGTPPNGLTVASTDLIGGSLSLVGDQVGTYNLGYTVTDGPAAAKGVIRVDIIEGGAEQPPVAEDDIAMLPEGGQVLIDPLVNDFDPNGGVLALTEVEAGDTGLTIAILDHKLLRISAPSSLKGPTSFVYHVSNGSVSRTARVMVVPIPAVNPTRSLELNDDQLIVRVGDVGSVRVLDNDRSLLGLRLTVMDDLQHAIRPEVGEPFLSNNVVRFRAGEKPGTGRIIYTVRDAAGTVASAQVLVTVLPADPERNQPPRPRDLEARVFQGGQVRIPVPLDGIDPDGDSVVLLDVGQGRLGTARIDRGSILYESNAGTVGTDTLRYTVQDRLRASAEGVIKVGVVSRLDYNRPPVAGPDMVLVRPDKRLAVPVLINDSDPDGDRLALVDNGFESPDFEVSIRRPQEQVVFTAPEKPGIYSFTYQVTDGVDNDTGLVTVRVSEDAPLLPPIAVDDIVAQEDVLGQTEITVDVLANDTDPDGDIGQATVTSDDPGVKVNPDKTLTIPLLPDPQLVLYTVTDVDNQQASAIVRVPGNDETKPYYDKEKGPIKVKAGESVTVKLNDYIKTRPERSVIAAGQADAGPGWDGQPIVKDATTLVFGTERTAGPTNWIKLIVTDGASLNDPEGRTAEITLPVEVTPADNRPPTFQGAQLSVGAGEDPVVTDLPGLVTDPDGDDPKAMSYRIVSAPPSITADISGTTLRASTAVSTQLGDAGVVVVEVTNDEHKVEARFPVTVTASTKPLVKTTPVELTAQAGQAVTVNLAQYTTNPFDSPLRVVNHTVDGSATVNFSGLTATITPAPETHGTVVVRYRVGDATEQPTREVDGVITLTVRDRPAPPSGLSATVDGGSVFLTWQLNADNGAPITDVEVSDLTQKDSKKCGAVTQCVLTNRTFGVEHTFVVKATNEVGTSEASNQTVIMVDTSPDQPSAPVLRPLDKQVEVRWTAPFSAGTPINKYVVVLSPGGVTQEVSVRGEKEGTPHTITMPGTNGTAYTATVQAFNSYEKPSNPSFASAPVTPYGRPGPAVNVAAATTNLGQSADTAAVVVTWQPVSNINGRAIEYYTVTTDGMAPRQVPANGPLQAAYNGVTWTGQQKTFSVTATNDSGQASTHTSEAISASTWLYGELPAPTISNVRPTGTNNQVQVSFNANAGRGWTAGEQRVQYQVGSSNWAAIPSGGVITHSGLVNGQATTMRFRSVASKAGAQSESPSVTTTGVNAYGPPTAGTVRCEVIAGGARCSYTIGSGNGRAITNYKGTTDGQNGTAYSANGADTYQSYSTNHRLCVWVTQKMDDGNTRTVSGGCDSVTSLPEPPPPPTYTNKHWVSISTNFVYFADYPQPGNYKIIRLRFEDYAPNSTVTCRWRWRDSSMNVHYDTRTYTMNSSGAWGLADAEMNRYASGKVPAKDYTTTGYTTSAYTCDGNRQ